MLQDFRHIDDGKDRGQGCRDLSRIILELISDEGLLREEREKARAMKARCKGIATTSVASGGGIYCGSIILISQQLQ